MTRICGLGFRKFRVSRFGVWGFWVRGCTNGSGFQGLDLCSGI